MYKQLGVKFQELSNQYEHYLRQNFEVSILESFNITLAQLSQCYAMLGITFAVSFLPSGWLADRFSSKKYSS